MVRTGVYSGFTHHDPKVLVLGRTRGSDPLAIAQVKLKELGKYVSQSDLDIHMVLNLKRLFERLPYDLMDVFLEARSALEELKSKHKS